MKIHLCNFTTTWKLIILETGSDFVNELFDKNETSVELINSCHAQRCCGTSCTAPTFKNDNGFVLATLNQQFASQKDSTFQFDWNTSK